ncbi:uncharacterized protein LOC112468837 [Temnothorax curvispinosus]|uniref:Uncharacterized protein LOC112468837 n=1 Tax=Temnothorax curvispinosus TaxID=300111 RepID=A0A6J1RI02_9HYME|nr:uncharacterized protein LOC112468837 [Temnothorax curvispinosus]
MLKDILEKFKEMNVCSGLGDISIHFVVVNGTYQDNIDKSRSKGCSLLSKKKRCDSCMKWRKCILQQKARLKIRPQMASMQNTAVDKKLAELDNISKSEKLVVQEIIAAARKKDAKGRRYSDDWIMLCMLINIQSPRNYEFLRKNNILPFPCTRTIRSYFSLINAKCGFDEEFAKLLEKHFASKTPLQRHGAR